MTTVRMNVGSDRPRDELILIARMLLVVLFIVFGWDKLTHYVRTVSEMAQTGLPMSAIATVVAVAVETFFALAVALAGPLTPFSNTKRWFAVVEAHPAPGQVRAVRKHYEFKKVNDEDSVPSSHRTTPRAAFRPPRVLILSQLRKWNR